MNDTQIRIALLWVSLRWAIVTIAFFSQFCPPAWWIVLRRTRRLCLPTFLPSAPRKRSLASSATGSSILTLTTLWSLPACPPTGFHPLKSHEASFCQVPLRERWKSYSDRPRRSCDEMDSLQRLSQGWKKSWCPIFNPIFFGGGWGSLTIAYIFFPYIICILAGCCCRCSKKTHTV